ncbi:MAG: type II toxin-antitoxin system VapB family antitoxin [Candidatus Aureabacteria bacterium]|nr:type II toxin-antitoxin system VapB family antitoxin [Candidatus Auribacterota bacterium]
MRTTLNLDGDVLDQARARARELGASFRAVVNQALRAGLDHLEKSSRRRVYRTRPRALGLRKGCSLDNVQELLDQVEGEDRR